MSHGLHMMPGWHPVVWITLLSSGMLSNFQVRTLTLQMCKYVNLTPRLSSYSLVSERLTESRLPGALGSRVSPVTN